MRRSRWARIGPITCTAALAIAGAATPVAFVLPQQIGPVDLLTDANVRLVGTGTDALTGVAARFAGDVNGDGVDDLVVGAHFADANGRTDSGSAYVVFGGESLGTVDLAALGGRGFRIDGAKAGDYAGTSVAGADVNGDGLSDVILGASGADPNGLASAGAAYVVYGTRSPRDIDLAAIPTGAGFPIRGAAAGDNAGGAVAALGDLTGDGRDEFAVGANGADNNGRTNSGSVYVVYGAPSSGGFDLSIIGAYGLRIDGEAADGYAGTEIAGGGDVNGDGRLDLVVGAPFGDANGRQNSGSVYVVYGPLPPVGLDLAAPGPRFFRLTGEAAGDLAGVSLALGDVTGDARSEVLIGAPYADHNGRTDSGSAYVVLGIPSSAGFDLSVVGAYGFRVDGASAGDATGFAVAGGSDLNGDGVGDIAVGGFGIDANGRGKSGGASVVYGRSFAASVGPVDLSASGTPGFTIAGAAAGDEAGTRLASLGDANGDGRPDLLIGAPRAGGAAADSGEAYVLYGVGTPQLAYEPVTASVGTQLVPRSPSLLRRTGPASFAVAPTLPAGLSLDPATGELTGTPESAQPLANYTVTMTDLAGSATATLAIQVDAEPDTTPPDLQLGGASTQRLLARKAITVTARCDEACTLTATGSVTISGTQLTLPLQRATGRLDSPGQVSLKLRFSAAAQKQLRRLWASGLRVRAQITVQAADGASNVTTARRTVTVRR